MKKEKGIGVPEFMKDAHPIGPAQDGAYKEVGPTAPGAFSSPFTTEGKRRKLEE
jgi:hypothetical protein